MSNPDNSFDFLSDLLARARKAGADAADALLVESSGQSATWRLGKLETVLRRRDVAAQFLGALVGVLTAPLADCPRLCRLWG